MLRLFPRGRFAQGCCLFLLAFGVRLADLLIERKWEIHSWVEVERAARCLAETGVLGDAFGKGTGPTAHVPPLYTLLLAGIYTAFGAGSFAAILTQRILSSLVTALTIALLPWIGRRAGLDGRVGLLAGAIMALSPVFFFVEVYARQETPYAALLGLLLLGNWLRLRETGWQGRGPRTICGILAGLAGLLAPQLLAFLALAFLIDFMARSGLRGRIFRCGVGAAMISAVLIAPWTVRNYFALGGFVPLRSNFGLELGIGNNPFADGYTFTGPTSHQNDPEWPHPFSNQKEKARLMDVGELVYMRERTEQAKTWIREHPARFTELCARRAWLFWFPPKYTWSEALRFREIRVAFIGGLTVLSLGGVVLLMRSRQASRWPLTLSLIAPSLVYLVTHTMPRYRYVNLWITVLIASYTLCYIYDWLRARWERERGDSFSLRSLTLPARQQTHSRAESLRETSSA